MQNVICMGEVAILFSKNSWDSTKLWNKYHNKCSEPYRLWQNLTIDNKKLPWVPHLYIQSVSSKHGYYMYISEQSFNIYQRDSEHYYIIKVLLIQDTTFNFWSILKKNNNKDRYDTISIEYYPNTCITCQMKNTVNFMK